MCGNMQKLPSGRVKVFNAETFWKMVYFINQRSQAAWLLTREAYVTTLDALRG
jgi:hypothetical protein